MVDKMQRNIRLLSLLKAGHMFMIAMAVIVPYWNERGLDQQSIYQLQAVFLLTVVISEIPSGYLADRVGRRTSLILGHMFWTLGWIGYVAADSWGAFAVAEILMGHGVSCNSGADSSLRYDSLMYVGEEHRNLRESSRAISWGSLCEGVAGLVGAGLALISLKTPIIAQAVVSVSMTPFVFLLTEAPYSKHSYEHSHGRELWRITRLTLHDSRDVKWLVLYSAGLGTMTYTAVWLMQPFYLDVGIAIGWFGILWLVKNFGLFFFGRRAEDIRNRLGLHMTLVILPIIGVATYVLLGAGYSLWVLPAFLGFEFVRGIQFPLIMDLIHQRTESHIRSTVLSVNGLVLRGFFAIFALFMGRVSDGNSIRTVFWVSAVTYGLLNLVLYRGLRRNLQLDRS